MAPSRVKTGPVSGAGIYFRGKLEGEGIAEGGRQGFGSHPSRTE